MPETRINPAAFPARLRELREAAGLSVTGLAAAVGVSRQHARYLETGERQPTWPMVCALARALGVTPDAFLGA